MMRGFLSLGSNQGDREAYLRRAIECLRQERVVVLARSSIYETRPVEVDEEQMPYLNLVAWIVSDRDPLRLLELCQRVEVSLGRKRPYAHAPRTIDIDILMLDGLVLATPALTLPHPRLEVRAFVIHPLSELCPSLMLPSGRSLLEVKKALGDDEIVGVWKDDHGQSG